MDTTEHQDAPPPGDDGDESTVALDLVPAEVAPPSDAGEPLPAVAGSPDGSESAPSVIRARPGRWRRRIAWILAIPLTLVVALFAAWAIDGAVTGDDVARNTELAGTPVGGMDTDELSAVVAELAQELPGTQVVIDTGDLELETTAGDLGLSIDSDATLAAVGEVGDQGNVLVRPFEWLGSFFTPRAAEVVIVSDEATTEATLAALEGDERRAPVEPTLAVVEGSAQLVAGKDGIELRAQNVLDALPSSLGNVNEPIVVQAQRTVVPPATSDDAVTPLVDQANELAGRTISVTAGDQTFELVGTQLIDGVSVLDVEGKPRLTVAETVIGQQIAAQAGLDANPTDVTFVLGGSGLVPTAGHDAQVCCGEGATEAIVDALLAGESAVTVPTKTITAAEGVQWASGLGVNQVVSEFTTNHPCCQSRVSNIHTLADQIRGTLVAPGETFSINDTSGRRTTDKGYVAAPAIVDGEHVQDVGGGVSQFATTTFNAAFFAGLPIPQYKMHSEYISRYPYAREATIFYPSVDLKFKNDTPYGIVVWPTYTGTSITVQLWSTPWARGEETAKSKSAGCGSVTTERTISYPDGTQDTDTFRANYRCT